MKEGRICMTKRRLNMYHVLTLDDFDNITIRYSDRHVILIQVTFKHKYETNQMNVDFF